MEPQNRPISMLECAEFLAIWNGLYVGAAYVCLATLVGRRPDPLLLGAVMLLAVSTYLLDRVKLSRAAFDPADLITHPRRAQFIQRHHNVIRLVVLISGLVASGALAAKHPLAALLVPLAWAGVLFYARSQRLGWRPKDVFILKNACVAGSIVALSVATLLMEQSTIADALAFAQNQLLPISLASIFLGLHIYADAAACDIDDRKGDAQFSTRTFPVVWNSLRTWLIIAALNVAAFVLALTAGLAQTLHAEFAYLWASLLPFGTSIVFARAGRRPRVATDIKFPAIALLVVMLGSFLFAQTRVPA